MRANRNMNGIAQEAREGEKDVEEGRKRGVEEEGDEGKRRRRIIQVEVLRLQALVGEWVQEVDAKMEE